MSSLLTDKVATQGVVTSIPPIDALTTGIKINQVIKGYICSESSDQGVRKSGDQAPLES